MQGTFGKISYLFSPAILVPVTLFAVIGTSPVDAKEIEKVKSNKNGKKIASVSLPATEKAPEKVAPKPNSKKKAKKNKVVQDVSSDMKNMAQLSDDEVTRIKLIKRYEGIKNPRTDWNNGLRTLDWHYTGEAE